jgi:hypothetical protein
MKQNEAFDPLDIGFFGTDTIPFYADDLPHLIQKPRVSTSIGMTCLNHTVVSSSTIETKDNDYILFICALYKTRCKNSIIKSK